MVNKELQGIHTGGIFKRYEWVKYI